MAAGPPWPLDGAGERRGPARSPGVPAVEGGGLRQGWFTPCQQFLPGGSRVVVARCHISRGPRRGSAAPGGPCLPAHRGSGHSQHHRHPHGSGKGQKSSGGDG